MISEKNKRINEILGELHRGEDIFEPLKNVMENPERVMEVNAEEIQFKKYLTREERDKIEKERLKEEERLLELMKDDAGVRGRNVCLVHSNMCTFVKVRALKDMMDGTLEEKKENPLDEGLEVEDWMSKPAEDMNEEERVRFKEYEVKRVRLEEEKEKIRKNLENELKKLKSDVNDICAKYDERLLLLFKRKLEFDYRISEQELSVVRLAQSVLSQKDMQVKKGEFLKTIQQLDEKFELAQRNHEHLIAYRAELEDARNKYSDNFQASLNVKPLHGVD